MRPVGGAATHWHALVLLACFAAAPAGAQTASSVAVRGTDFRLELPDGRTLRGSDLVGATLGLSVAGVVREVRIVAAERDPRDRIAGRTRAPDDEIWLFDLRTADAAGDWQPLCSPDPDGRQLGFPLAGGGDPSRMTLTCTSGAVGKCVRLGYAPWRPAPEAGGAPMAAYHAACVHMLRAAYGGDARAWTRNGTRIDVYDRAGIQVPAPGAAMPFEAGWSPSGAVCLAHVRIPENGDLEAVTAAVPRLAAHAGEAACTEAGAWQAGALLFNRSEAR